jgi:hypothetical protein
MIILIGYCFIGQCDHCGGKDEIIAPTTQARGARGRQQNVDNP